MTEHPEQLLTVAEVAEILRVSERYVWRLRREDRLAGGALTEGKRDKHGRPHPRGIRFKRSAVEAFIAERLKGPQRQRPHVERPKERIANGGRPRRQARGSSGGGIRRF